MDNEFDFTMRAENEFYDLIEKEDFSCKDANYIYECLQNKIRPVNFGEYLKRYIYTSLYGEESGHSPDYRGHIISMFEMNNVPSSMHGSSTKLSAAAANWLSQKRVTRGTVFLLGFGLGMTVDEVSKMLVNAAGDSDFDFKNPYEIIYWFCYRNLLGFREMKKITDEFEAMDTAASEQSSESDYAGKTTELKGRALRISSREELMEFLSGYGKYSMKNRTAYAVFSQLYEQAKLIAGILDGSGSGNARAVERQLYIGIFRTAQGNLPPASDSELNDVFGSKRLNRKRIGDIEKHVMLPERFDIITLNFFVHANKQLITDCARNIKQDYYSFIDDTNKLLRKCHMSELYAANPYENFIAMCMMTTDPLITFAEVWSKSYEDSGDI
ncbi:MAG: hypothetical protein J6K17_11495 [Oscillospiraceae bacterium]|nr:hypothetical protein [Oscillospiraceae bacterium]